jgi:PAS domain S-box-containing protein
MRLIADSGSDLKKLTRSAAQVTAEALGDSSMILLLNTDGEKVNVSAFHDIDPTAGSLMQKLVEATIEFPRDQGLTGRVLRSGEPILITSIPRKQLIAVTLPVFVEYIKRVGVKSALVVPLIGRSGVLGVISLARHRGSESYTLEDQAFVTEIAFRTAMAIENGMLFDSLRTEIKRRVSTKEALDASEEHFRSIFEATTLGVQILDLVGTMMNANQAFQKMLGYTEAEMIGKNFQDFLHPDDTVEVRRHFNTLKLDSGADRQFEHRAILKDGSTIWVKTLFSGVRHSGADSSLEFIVAMSENITEQKLLQSEMVELKNRLQEGQELERLRLARELHDGPMQDLQGERYRIEELRKKAKPPLRDALEEVSRDIEKVIENLRNSAKELRPPTLSSFGLETAIRSYMRDFQDKYPHIRVHLVLARDQQLLPEEMRLTLFRVLQQSLTNVVRHSQATRVWVNFSFDEGKVSLMIRDNGKGFKVPTNWIGLVRNRHYGLAGMAERISDQGGTFTVESEPQKPTVVQAVIPWNGKSPDLKPFDKDSSLS